MPSVIQESTWDFAPVFNLIQSLSSQGSDTQPKSHVKLRRESSYEPTSPLDDGIDGGLGLGNFDKIWDYLGVQRSVPPPSVPPFEAATSGRLEKTERDAYASDSALYFPSSAKGVRWRDEETEGADLADTQAEAASKGGLTKNQRKKRNRKERKADEAQTLAEQTRQQKASEDFGSEAELENSPAVPERISTRPAKAEAKNSGIPLARAVSASRSVPAPTTPLAGKSVKQTSPPLQPLDKGLATKSTGTLQPVLTSVCPPSLPAKAINKSSLQAVPVTPSKSAPNTGKGLLRPAQVAPRTNCTFSLSDHIEAELGKFSSSTTKSKTPVFQTSARPLPDVTNHQKQWPMSNPTTARMHSMPPEPLDTIQAVHEFGSRNVAQTQTPTRKRHELLPIAYETAAHRNWMLLLKLMKNFPAERDSLLSPLQLSINRPSANGIHVFVDASNILIGFHDALKRARGIPQGARVPRADLSFHALALLLERRRPVTKRVLAGSTPEIAAFEEARQVGYETCILDKVFKAKELTERQKRFAQRAMSSSSERYYASGSASDGNGNVPSADTLPPQQAKWIEQAVDEILHLKMMESIVDTEVPGRGNSSAQVPAAAEAPTMILATGDAAEAEYSPGFMRMVERALGKGWNVEVAAWGANISMSYRRMEKTAQWGKRFKIIELDDYAEELFGQSV